MLRNRATRDEQQAFIEVMLLPVTYGQSANKIIVYD